MTQTDDLTLAEMLRVMDVASELRRQQVEVDRQFAHDELRAQMREKLLAAAVVTGEQLTMSDVDTAIDWYFDHLHRFRQPKASFSVLLAQLYIRRYRVLMTAVLVAGGVFLVWSNR